MLNLLFYCLSRVAYYLTWLKDKYLYGFKPALNKTVFYLNSVMLSILMGAVLSLFGSVWLGAIIAAILFLASLSTKIYPRGALCMAMAPANVAKIPGTNMSGTAGTFAYALFSDILTWPAALQPAAILAAATYGALVTVPIDDPFVMATGKRFWSCDCILEEGEVLHTQIGPRDCAAFENSYDNVFPGNDAGYLGFSAFAANEDIVVIATELNGACRVIGFPGFPARVEKAAGNSGKKVADGRKQTLTIVSRGLVPAPLYLAPIPFTPAT